MYLHNKKDTVTVLKKCRVCAVYMRVSAAYKGAEVTHMKCALAVTKHLRK